VLLGAFDLISVATSSLSGFVQRPRRSGQCERL
jgi:hypothetical protein